MEELAKRVKKNVGAKGVEGRRKGAAANKRKCIFVFVAKWCDP